MTEGSYDVFKGLPDKKPLWLGAVPGLQRATEQMNRMAARLPGDYFVFNPRTNSIEAFIRQGIAPMCAEWSNDKNEKVG